MEEVRLQMIEVKIIRGGNQLNHAPIHHSRESICNNQRGVNPSTSPYKHLLICTR